MYTSFTLTTTVINNSLVAKNCRDPACITKGSKDYPGFQSTHKELWSNIFKTPYTITMETNLQSFQYKIIHQLITCHFFLFDIKLVDNAKCKYCHDIFDIFNVLIYCILLAKFHIYCHRIHNNNAINLFQHLIELKNKLKIEHYICASNSIGKFEQILFLYEQL